jgi:hypothetical protein
VFPVPFSAYFRLGSMTTHPLGASAERASITSVRTKSSKYGLTAARATTSLICEQVRLDAKRNSTIDKRKRFFSAYSRPAKAG